MFQDKRLNGVKCSVDDPHVIGSNTDSSHLDGLILPPESDEAKYSTTYQVTMS